MDEDEELLHDAEHSLDETEKARKEEEDATKNEPWAKTSSGDADSVTTDDDEDD